MSKLSVTIDGRAFEVEISIPPQHDGAALLATVDGQVLRIAASGMDSPDQIEWIMVEDRSHEIIVDRDLRWLRSRRGLHRLDVRDLDAPVPRPLSGDGRVKAPIPGIVTRVLVGAGDHVAAGQPIIVIEAMKMENEIRAPRDGVVSRLDVGQGQSVALQQVLAEIT